MKFTIGICTDGNASSRVNFIIECYKTIVPQDCLEIIVVGGKKIVSNNVNWIAFDESVKSGWITRKKNLITENANYDNIVYSHDYLFPASDWYEGWKLFGENFEIAMNKILNWENTRHADWVADSYLMWELMPETKDTYDVLLPYDTVGLTKIQYINGLYWVAKKQFMQRFPLDESLTWGSAEDIKWSRIIREYTEFKMNAHSTVKILKQGKWAPNLINSDRLKKMKSARGL